jgi:uncharacterized repeat protein (TIGR03803 family)
MRAKYVVLALAMALLLGLPLSARGAVKYEVLHNFGSGKDGSGPSGPLVPDSSGGLYGITGTGGTGQCSDYGCGTVFKLAPQANGRWKEAILHSFTAGSDGAIPWGVMVLDQSGNLYGSLLGDNGLGGSGVFWLSSKLGGWSNQLIYTDGAGPGLLMDEPGNLYGEIGPGETKFYGAIGELSPGSNGWAYTELYSFCLTYCPDGFSPPTPPTWDGEGNMFGTTTEGGIIKSPCGWAFGCGVIYEMTPNDGGTWTYQVLHRFASFGTDGQTPKGGLAMDAAGDFYGTTELGGAYDNGIVFKLSHASGAWKVTQLYDFPDCNIGCVPSGTLAIDAAGNLYGTASGGLAACGGYDCGVVFEMSPQKDGKWRYRVLHKLTATDGGFPGYGVILDGKGHLFGVTSQFGKYGGGTAFEITP